MRKQFSVSLFIILAGCASPSSGPSVGDIYSVTLPGSDEKMPVLELVSALPDITNMPSATSSCGEFDRLQAAKTGGNGLQAGDVIEVTILDTGEAGLLSPTESKVLNLGRFTVDQDGSVTVPFVGRQPVKGASPEVVQNRIVDSLRGSAVNPQAVVTVVESPASTVTVHGDVRSIGRFPLASKRERVLDAIASAGGPGSPPGSTMVTLVRGPYRARAPLDCLLADDGQNVRLMPEDRILVEKNGSSFTALGAFKSNGEFEFETGKLTLAKAIGRVGGLLDDRADARNVYLFRNPNIHVAAEAASRASATEKPVIYRLNLRDVANFVLMQGFLMQDGDILYAGNARIVDLAKLLTVFQKSVSLPAASPPAE
ncbi:polysaccharide biosynthesis/export family protein [Chelativorans sp. AA-79]|uniref:polysaccharide biosynthesis/export family protein n=1 Tax=Chelativorans sp. AA-79 TaxID=3028735 RepID=UPI0023F737BE|nr:polysaccharide biosynthesis/export family protein [Chelativorans sp. AA-79]WEX08250.1 polysaccharide export protein [Chelativorans sp. AA-79]